MSTLLLSWMGSAPATGKTWDWWVLGSFCAVVTLVPSSPTTSQPHLCLQLLPTALSPKVCLGHWQIWSLTFLSRVPLTRDPGVWRGHLSAGLGWWRWCPPRCPRGPQSTPGHRPQSLSALTSGLESQALQKGSYESQNTECWFVCLCMRLGRRCGVHSTKTQGTRLREENEVWF